MVWYQPSKKYLLCCTKESHSHLEQQEGEYMMTKINF